MPNKIQVAIYKTLIYSDLFHFPLTDKEIYQYLIWEEKEKPPMFEKVQNTLSKLNLKARNGYYYLLSQEIVAQRLNKASLSQKKKQIAQNIGKMLSKIPTIKFIGLSGNLAMDNAEEKDDIDLFIITQKNTLWLSRFFLTLVLDIKKLRRKPNEQKWQDKICLNMQIDESKIILPKEERNLYTAHEIVQLVPLVNKNQTYEKFLTANKWFLKFLPNSPLSLKISASIFPNNKPQFLILLQNLFLPLFNFLFFVPQLIYQKRRQTKEIVKLHYLRFHPQDNSSLILRKFNRNFSQIIAQL